MSRPLWQFGAAELHQAFQAGDATPVEALQSCLARVAAVQPRINAFVTLRADRAMQEAQASAERYRHGTPLSALDGVPVSIKDNLLTDDMPTTWGSPGLKAHQPGAQELAVTRLRAGGAIVIGKTNVPEFTLEGYTDNPLFGVSRNPWNLALTPGGSSGGAAASVAAGCTPIALGTDGGGSIRRPAAHCGLVGLKPTIGSIARVQGLPTLLLDFEVVGLMARTVEDVALLLQATEGPDAADPASWQIPGRRHAMRAVDEARVLYVPTIDSAPVDADIARACARAAQRLPGAVVTGPLPLDLDAISAAWPQVGQIGLAHLFEQHPAWGAAASPKYQDMARQGRELPAPYLWRVLEQVQQLRRDCARLFAQWDVIAMPCTAAQPWPAQQPFPTEIDGHAVGPRGHAAMTGWVNAAGLPAISVPIEPDAHGLPIGLQLVGGPGAEPLLLRLAGHLQAEYRRQQAWPAL